MSSVLNWKWSKNRAQRRFLAGVRRREFEVIQLAGAPRWVSCRPDIVENILLPGGSPPTPLSVVICDAAASTLAGDVGEAVAAQGFRPAAQDNPWSRRVHHHPSPWRERRHGMGVRRMLVD